MSCTTAILSSKGQLVIPKEIRDELHWEPGTQIALVANATSVTLKAVPKKTGRRFESLLGMLQSGDAVLDTEALCSPVDARADWEATEKRSR